MGKFTSQGFIDDGTKNTAVNGTLRVGGSGSFESSLVVTGLSKAPTT